MWLAGPATMRRGRKGERGRSAGLCQQPPDHGLRLPPIAAAEQVQVVQDVVQVVEVLRVW